MRRAAGAALVALLVACAGGDAHEAPTPAFGAYREPEPAVVHLLTAPRPPETLVHTGSGRVALLHAEPVVPLARLARPWLGLAGFRFDPESGTSGALLRTIRVEVVSRDAAPRVWDPAGGAGLQDVRFSPDGRWLSAVATARGAAELRLFDLESGREHRLGVPLQAGFGAPCAWATPETLLCLLLPEDRGAPPARRVEPDTYDHAGAPLPLRTYSHLLNDAHEEALFDHYFTSALARVGVDGTVDRSPASRGVLVDPMPSPDATHAVVTRLLRPYSRIAPAHRFPSVVEVWNLAEERRVYASPPRGLGVPEDERHGPRRFAWRPGTPTALGWIEKTAEGERWVALEAPYDAEPATLARSERPIRRFAWTTAASPLYETRSPDGRVTSYWAAHPDGSRLLGSGELADPAADPGRPLREAGPQSPIVESEGRIFLAGQGLAGRRPEPFLDALDLATGESETLFQSEPGVFEEVVGMLDPAGRSFATSRETESQPPHWFAIEGGARTLLRAFASPVPALDAADRRRLTYLRDDGVELHATLYLPEGWREKRPLPTLVWIYPREYDAAELAEQIDVRLFRYHPLSRPMPLTAVLRGYAVVVNPTLPIIGEGEERNDAYLPQLEASARALVDHLVEMGVADRERVAVGGHSYGAFSAANLLIHTDLFATGVAVSGAYNRTLTPFGFQHERRSLWSATDFYANVSPFFHADDLARPILLVHGGADSNTGTPTFQTRRFFHALVGVGARARYVELPYEDHHLLGRESTLHAAAEMLDWLDATLGAPAD